MEEYNNRCSFHAMMLRLFTAALISTTQLSHAYAPLVGVTALSVKTSKDVDLSTYLSSSKKTMLVLGTYAADFNAIEYAQRLRYYMPDLQKRGVTKIGRCLLFFRLCIPVDTPIPIVLTLHIMRLLTMFAVIGLVLNCESESAKKLADLVDLPCDVSTGYGVDLMVDPMGSAGKAFGVSQGWRPDDTEMSPFVKLFGMLFGLGVSE
jgi:hypothetical protein